MRRRPQAIGNAIYAAHILWGEPRCGGDAGCGDVFYRLCFGGVRSPDRLACPATGGSYRTRLDRGSGHASFGRAATRATGGGWQVANLIDGRDCESGRGHHCGERSRCRHPDRRHLCHLGHCRGRTRVTATKAGVPTDAVTFTVNPPLPAATIASDAGAGVRASPSQTTAAAGATPI
jgi:hypothetical protein